MKTSRKILLAVVLLTALLAGGASWTHAQPLAADADPPADRNLIPVLPDGWKVISSSDAPAQQVKAIGEKLGGDLIAVNNLKVQAGGTVLQVNFIYCRDQTAAARIRESLLKLHGNPAYCLLLPNSRVVEFVCDDIRAVLRAPFLLGFKPKQAAYRVTFDVAPVERCDYMASNGIMNLFMALERKPTDEAVQQQIAEKARGFEFGNRLTLRQLGPTTQPTKFMFDGKVAKEDALIGGDLKQFTFDGLRKKSGIPAVHVEGVVSSATFSTTPTKRKADQALLAATSFWPADNAEIKALAGQITAHSKTPEEKVEAILDWLMPGRNIRFGGQVTSSRFGVNQVLKQKTGQCWDFSDVFVTFCRASGVPARQVGGWLYGQCGHVWAEVLFEGKGWQQVDPTAGMETTSDYVAYFTTEDGHMPILYLGWPKVEMVKP